MPQHRLCSGQQSCWQSLFSVPRLPSPTALWVSFPQLHSGPPWPKISLVLQRQGSSGWPWTRWEKRAAIAIGRPVLVRRNEAVSLDLKALGRTVSPAALPCPHTNTAPVCPRTDTAPPCPHTDAAPPCPRTDAAPPCPRTDPAPLASESSKEASDCQQSHRGHQNCKACGVTE